MDAKQADTLQEIHNQWLSHPGTTEFIKNLRKLREAHVKNLSSKAADVNFTAEQYRQFGFSLKTVDAVLVMVSDFSKFKEQTEKQ